MPRGEASKGGFKVRSGMVVGVDLETVDMVVKEEEERCAVHDEAAAAK